MLHVTASAPYHAVWEGGGVCFADQVGTALGPVPGLRLVLSGRGHVDLPTLSDYHPDPDSPKKRPLDPLPSTLPSCASLQFTPTDRLTYSYERIDNRGNSIKEGGTDPVSLEQAELLGWLVGAGTINKDQSVRLALKDQGSVHTAMSVVQKASGSCEVNVYPKAAGFDITITKGDIHHQIRRMGFHNKFPCGISRLSERHVRAFLHGLWATDGWGYTKNGGNEIILGLSQAKCPYLLHGVAMLHAGLGINYRMEPKNSSHRIIVYGYNDYRNLLRLVGSVGAFNLMHSPVPKAPKTQTIRVAKSGARWYEATVQRSLHLPSINAYSLRTPCLTMTPTPRRLMPT